MHFHTFRFSPRLGIFVVAWAVLLGAQSQRANAQDQVWFEAVPVSPGALVLDEGPGLALSLACDIALQPEDPVFLWDITMRFQNEMPLYGWTMNLRTVADSVSGIEYEYGEKVLSPHGILQGYVPLPTVLDFAELGYGRELTQYVGMHSLSPCQTYEASTDGVAWSVFKMRLAKATTDVDSGYVEIFGETGGAGWYDEIGWGSAIIGDNDLMEVWHPGTRYPYPLITIDSPQGAQWSPGMEGPLYPPDEEPPVGHEPVDEPPVDEPPIDESPDPAPPVNNPEEPNDNDNNSNSAPVYFPGVLYQPVVPQVPVNDSDNDNENVPQPTPAPKPLPGSDSLIAQCGAQSSTALMMAVMGIVGLKARRRKRIR